MKPEKTVERQIIKFLESQNVWHMKVHGGSTFQRAGIPDILACINGRFVGIEIKRPDGKGKVSKLQEFHIESIRKSGGVAFVCESLEEFFMELKNAKFISDVVVFDTAGNFIPSE